MKTPGALVSIVIATYNRSAYLLEPLNSLSSLPCWPGGLEIHVVNNNSTDATETVASGFASLLPGFKLVMERDQGLSHARNRGVNEASGSLVVFLDDEVEVHTAGLSALLEPFEDDRVAVSGGDHQKTGDGQTR